MCVCSMYSPVELKKSHMELLEDFEIAEEYIKMLKRSVSDIKSAK